MGGGGGVISVRTSLKGKEGGLEFGQNWIRGEGGKKT